MRRKVLLTWTALLLCFLAMAQSPENKSAGFTSSKKGDISIYFGWNKSVYSNSDIRFKGSDYDFIIHNAKASDRQTSFSMETYFGLKTITIPQTNMGVNYQLTDKVLVSFNVDHMKYVLDQNQLAEISGDIGSHYGPYSGSYNKTPTIIDEDLVRFEHTDGLNYINLSYARTNHLLNISPNISLQGNYGGGLGFLLPKTNSTLLGKNRYDDFHLSGYGLSSHGTLQLNISKWFYFASTLKGGYINMPDIRTSMDKSDKASQAFWYCQWNFMFGLKCNLKPKS